MQDYEPNSQPLDEEIMEPRQDTFSTEPQNSGRDLPRKVSTAASEMSNIRPYERGDTPLENEQNLPDAISSDYENIPLDCPEFTEGESDFVEEKTSDENDPETSEIVAKNPPNAEKSVLVEVDESSTERRDDDFVDNKSIIETARWKLEEKFDDCRDEASIEDSCEGALKREREIVNVDSSRDSSIREKLTNHETNRAWNLSEDSRLVKIPLPTSSINIMQSNAQFLNRSRNFLNFITEKSTNIMEKTLLPQNIAVRYNSLLKLSDDFKYATEKKLCEDSCNVAVPSTTNLSSRSEPNLTSKSRTVDDRSGNDAADVDKTESENGESTSKSDAKPIFPTTKVSNDSYLSTGICDVASSTSLEKNNDSVDSDRALESKIFQSQLGDISDVPEREPEAGRYPPGESDALAESSRGLLRHPVYLTLVRDYAKARDEKAKLADRVKHLEERNRILEAQNSSEAFDIQLEALEKTVERLTGELRSANCNQEELGREYAAANKERESMVMKYAVSEKQLIDTQRARDYAERRYKEIAKDHELLQNKLRQAQSERTRICNILDVKCRELTDLQKEVERLKEDVNVRDVKLKWTQNKLKTEMEAQKETQQKLDKATTRINDMKEECEQVRRESQEMIRKFQHSEENKAVTLDHQLKEQQARLILERHVTEDKEMLRLQLQKEVDLLKNRQQVLIEENNTLSLKVQDAEKERLAYESKLSELKIIADQRQKEIVDLSSKVSHLETLKLQLIHKEQCLASNEAEVERLRQVNQELQADMDCCRQREAHMLDFTQKLTDKNVRLQSEFTSVEAKAAQLEQEQGPLRDGITELRAKVKTLEENLSYEKKKRTEECEILARHLAEQTQLAQNLSQKLEDSQGEVAVLRRKRQASVKEMSRELQQCRKRLEAYESASPSNSLDPTSRTGSNTSLNTGETLNGVASEHSGNGESTLQSAELDKQSLIDRILRMQKINVRRAEKLDFLEEHTRSLVAELQKKTKIIQNYIMHENFDAMGSNERDRHKAELARHGGIMASVYNHRVSDDNMTLELSLEINQKLQAVLEDALLKNITLKDNIDTLGEEIARLTMKNQQMLQQKGK